MQMWRFLPRSLAPKLPPYDHQTIRPSLPADALTPYLGLRSRLSQVWINRWTILLLLVLARMLIAIASLNVNMASAKREALSACSSVEAMGSAMASMPHYMSKGVNELTASGVEKAVNGLISMLLLIVTGVEEIIVFFINVLTQTYLCLITLVISGSLHAALEIIKKATDFLDSALGKIGDGIADVASGFQDSLNDFVDGINSITSAFGGGDAVPKLDMSGSIDDLKNLKLPDDLDEDLAKLNASIPTFEDVNNFTNNALRFPFEKIKGLINDSLGEYTFDRSVFPVPAKETMSFCSDDDGINSFFNDLKDIIATAQKIFLVVLIMGAIAACAPMAWREIRAWRKMKEHSLLVSKEAHDPMDVVYIVSRPYTSSAGLKVSNWFKSSRRQILVRWVIAYATSPPALFVLCLGIAGLFACACQLALLAAVKKQVPGLTDQVSQFADKVVNSLNNASEQWAISTNRVIDDANNDINQKVFGWVDTSTEAMNDTLNVFVDKTSGVLNDTFGGTILYDPIKEVLHCLIGLKIEGIQKALTWVHDNAHVDFPNLANDTFSLGAIESIASDNQTDPDSFLANPGDETADAITAAVKRVTDAIQSGIETEAIISFVIVCIWLFILLIAILRALTLFYRRDKTRGEGGGNSEFYNPTTISRDIDGFQDVPLGPVSETAKYDAAGSVPQYSTTPNAYPRTKGVPQDTEETAYQDQKLGFAGQRDYGSALNYPGNNQTRVSSHCEVEYGDEKR